MKKFGLLGVLLLVIFVTGCSWWGKKENNEGKNVVNAEINVESCNKYFELVNCIIDNDPDNSYSAEDRELIREAINDRRNDWASLDDESLDNMCNAELSNFLSTVGENSLIEIGCAIN